jgi:hypothetical protein
VRSFTPLEAALGVALVGSVLAATVPTFVRNVHASRLVEPVDGLNRIATRATWLAAGHAAEFAYPESVGLTPAEVPKGVSVTDPPGTWDHPTWRRLQFQWTVDHAYSFAFESEAKPGLAVFRAFAHGDLDGDGLFSTFEIRGSTRDGGEPVASPVSIYRELE